MMLTGQQLARIHEAILDAYDRDELRQMILSRMNEDFSRHVSPEKRFSAQVFEFVEWANRQGRALELLRCAAEGNARNEGLQALWAEAQGWDSLLQSVQTPEPSASPAAPHHVFLAYSRKDDAIMRQLRSDLLAAGIVAWVDQDDLEPGNPVWQRAIEAAIRAAKCVVAILTPEAKESEWVNIELSRAKRIGGRIFPVLARGDEDSAVPLLLETTNHVDIRTNYAVSVRDKLIPTLRKHLGMADAAMAVQQQAEAPMRSAEKDVKPTGTVTTRPESAKPTSQVSRPKSTIVKPPIDIEWITIPEGEFLMGSDKTKDKQASDNEMPQYRLDLPEYRIAKYPITNAQYQVFVKMTGHPVPEHWEHGAIPTGKENHPVVNVTWYSVEAFCEWLNVRLPSEAEWEKAARGIDGRIWPWGSEPPTRKRSNYGENVGGTTPVDSYSAGASPYGVMDMPGNVWEWTASLYEPYPCQPIDARSTLSTVGVHILRGGWWKGTEVSIRCAHRFGYRARVGDIGIGFRVASIGS